MGMNLLRPARVERYAALSGLAVVSVATVANNTHEVHAIVADRDHPDGHRHVHLDRLGNVTYESNLDVPVHWYTVCRAVQANPDITARELWDLQRAAT